MDPESQKRLDSILAMDPLDRSEDDNAFLMARRGYLSEELRTQLEAGSPPDVPSEPAEEEESTPSRKKSAK